MKKLLYATLMIAATAVGTSCSKSNLSTTPDEITTQPSGETTLSDVLKAGPWEIDYYVDEENKNVDFTGYVFTFKADGSLSLQKGNEFYTGQWKASKEEGVDKLVININTINILEKLDNKWQVKDVNSTKLEMRNDDNPKQSEFLNIKRI